jgi:hypothetical protein
MPKTIQAKVLSQIQYVFFDQDGQQTKSDADSTQNAANYTYGTGNFQVTNIVRSTGVIASGANTTIDFGSFVTSNFGSTGVLDFSRIKSVVINNTSTSLGMDLSIRATGTNAMTTLFNGSGNLTIKPYSSFMYNDPYSGIDSSTNSRVQLHNISSASGNLSYTITVMGLT